MPPSWRAGLSFHSTESMPTVDDGATSEQMWRRGVEPVAAPDQCTTAIWGVELVARAGEVVDPGGGQIDGSMRHELRPVHRQPRTVPMRKLGKPVQAAGTRR